MAYGPVPHSWSSKSFGKNILPPVLGNNASSIIFSNLTSSELSRKAAERRLCVCVYMVSPPREGYVPIFYNLPRFHISSLVVLVLVPR